MWLKGGLLALLYAPITILADYYLTNARSIQAVLENEGMTGIVYTGLNFPGLFILELLLAPQSLYASPSFLFIAFMATNFATGSLIGLLIQYGVGVIKRRRA
jgi:hypothetical protein